MVNACAIYATGILARAPEGDCDGSPARDDLAGHERSRARGGSDVSDRGREQPKEAVPSNWWLRASWRDQTLVVFVSPSAQQSFDLWYDTPRQKETLANLCKAIPVAIWSQIKPDQDIAVEQVVGGNGGKGSFQFSCRKYLAKSID